MRKTIPARKLFARFFSKKRDLNNLLTFKTVS